MKNLYLLLLLFTFSTRCFSQGKETKQEWIDSYKISVYAYGILHGLDDPQLTSKLVKIDKSFYNPFFETLHASAIKRGGNFLISLIEKDATDRSGRVSEPADGKRVFLVALKFYYSTVLSKIAEKEYRKWYNTPNKQKLIEKVNIAY